MSSFMTLRGFSAEAIEINIVIVQLLVALAVKWTHPASWLQGRLSCNSQYFCLLFKIFSKIIARSSPSCLTKCQTDILYKLGCTLVRWLVKKNCAKLNLSNYFDSICQNLWQSFKPCYQLHIIHNKKWGYFCVAKMQNLKNLTLTGSRQGDLILLRFFVSYHSNYFQHLLRKKSCYHCHFLAHMYVTGPKHSGNLDGTDSDHLLNTIFIKYLCHILHFFDICNILIEFTLLL